MGYRTQMQQISAGNNFDGTAPAGAMTAANGKRTYAEAAVGGLFDMGLKEAAHVMGVQLFGAGAVPLAGTVATVDVVGTVIADGETITIGTRTYTFEGTPAAIDDIQWDAAEATCMANLIKTINGTGTPGTEYYVGTTINLQVTAGVLSSVTSVFTAKIGGTAGNAIASTDTFTTGGPDTATLEDGLDDAVYTVSKVTVEGDEMVIVTATGGKV